MLEVQDMDTATMRMRIAQVCVDPEQSTLVLEMELVSELRAISFDALEEVEKLCPPIADACHEQTSHDGKFAEELAQASGDDAATEGLILGSRWNIPLSCSRGSLPDPLDVAVTRKHGRHGESDQIRQSNCKRSLRIQDGSGFNCRVIAQAELPFGHVRCPFDERPQNVHERNALDCRGDIDRRRLQLQAELAEFLDPGSRVSRFVGRPVRLASRECQSLLEPPRAVRVNSATPPFDEGTVLQDFPVDETIGPRFPMFRDAGE
jgi:hypothetical protein